MIDQVSGGRFLFGASGGWNAEEMADHGTAFKTRFKLMREHIAAMKEIWTKSQPEYHGELVDFQPMGDLDRLKRYRDLGIARVVVSLESVRADETLPNLDRWADLISRTQQR